MKRLYLTAGILSGLLATAAIVPNVLAQSSTSGTSSTGAGASGSMSGSSNTAANRASTSSTGAGAGASDSTSRTSANTGSSMSSDSTNGMSNSRTASNTGASTGVAPTWESENQYWRNQYSSRPYYNSNTNYSMYEPAYKYGLNTYNQNAGKKFEDLDQSQLRSGWAQARGNSNLSWEQAQDATRDAYNRLYSERATATSSNTDTSTR